MNFKIRTALHAYISMRLKNTIVSHESIWSEIVVAFSDIIFTSIDFCSNHLC